MNIARERDYRLWPKPRFPRYLGTIMNNNSLIQQGHVDVISMPSGRPAVGMRLPRDLLTFLPKASSFLVVIALSPRYAEVLGNEFLRSAAG